MLKILGEKLNQKRPKLACAMIRKSVTLKEFEAMIRTQGTTAKKYSIPVSKMKSPEKFGEELYEYAILLQRSSSRFL